jgi:hypothetical protein
MPIITMLENTPAKAITTPRAVNPYTAISTTKKPSAARK